MKPNKLPTILSILSAVIALTLAGCSDKGNVTAPQQVNFDGAQFAAVDYGDVQNGIEDATTTSDMTFNSALLSYNFIDGDRSFGPGDPALSGMIWFDRFDFRKHLGLFFKQLNLTDDQKTQIRDLAKTFQQDMKPLIQQFYDTNKTIIKDANVKRRVIMDEVKIGTITRDSAAALIKNLNQATRDLINNNPASQSLKVLMCAERAKLFAGIVAVLQGDQITKWSAWIAQVQNPCA